MTRHLRRTGGDRDRRGPRHRPRARARARAPGRARGRQRSRRDRSTATARRPGPPARWSRRSGASAARASPTATTSPTGKARAGWWPRDRNVGAPRRAGQQRRLPPRPDAGQRPPKTSGTRSSACTSRATSRRAARRRVLAQRAKAGEHGRRADDQHLVGRRPHGHRRPRRPTPRPRPGSPRSRWSRRPSSARYGVTANAIAPAARTRMTEAVFADTMSRARERLRRDGPGQRRPARGVARQRRLRRRHRAGLRGRGRHDQPSPTAGPRGPRVDRGARWEPAEVGPAVRTPARRSLSARKGLRQQWFMNSEQVAYCSGRLVSDA